MVDFSSPVSCLLLRPTVLLPALPDVHLRVQREVQVQPPVRLPLPMWDKWRKHVDLEELTPLVNRVHLGCTKRECTTNKKRLGGGKSNVFLNPFSRRKMLHFLSYNDHQVEKEELETLGELPEVCSQIVLKCLCLARFGRPDILRSGSYLERPFAKWNTDRGKILASLRSYIHCTSGCRQYCHVGNTTSHCKLGLFQDADLRVVWQIQNRRQERLFQLGGSVGNRLL